MDDDTQEVVSEIDLTSEYAVLANKDYEGRQGTLLKLNEIKLLLDNLPSTSAVAITSAKSIVEEWFSHQGAGTSFVYGQGKAKKKVALLGARGYVGEEFAKILAQHPDLELVMASSRALEGENVKAQFGLADTSTPSISDSLVFNSINPEDLSSLDGAEDVDVWVLALPNGLAEQWVDPLEQVGKKANRGTGALLIDLGADFRFTDEWTYGLPERSLPTIDNARKELRGTRKIANPGCYATGSQFGLMPLMAHGLVQEGTVPHVFGVSGYSGAGTTPSPNNDPDNLRDNIIGYALVNHIHEREISRHMQHEVAFMVGFGLFSLSPSLYVSFLLCVSLFYCVFRCLYTSLYTILSSPR